jgi:hypothetical protein
LDGHWHAAAICADIAVEFSGGLESIEQPARSTTLTSAELMAI